MKITITHNSKIILADAISIEIANSKFLIYQEKYGIKITEITHRNICVCPQTSNSIAVKFFDINDEINNTENQKINP